MLPPILARNVPNARSKVKHAPLRDRPLHERRDVVLRVPDRLQPAGDPKPVEEARDGLEEVRADGVVRDGGDGGVGRADPVEDRERLAVAVGRGGCGEEEDCWGGEGDAVREKVYEM